MYRLEGSSTVLKFPLLGRFSPNRTNPGIAALKIKDTKAIFHNIFSKTYHFWVSMLGFFMPIFDNVFWCFNTSNGFHCRRFPWDAATAAIVASKDLWRDTTFGCFKRILIGTALEGAAVHIICMIMYIFSSKNGWTGGELYCFSCVHTSRKPSHGTVTTSEVPSLSTSAKLIGQRKKANRAAFSWF